MEWHTVEIKTHKRVEVLDITEQVGAACARNGAAEGLAVVVQAHTTAGICINEAEPQLLTDLETWLERLAPVAGSYAHNTIDDNADAHLRAILLGASVCVPWMGRLALGTWQRILFVELDGPRTRQVKVAIVG